MTNTTISPYPVDIGTVNWFVGGRIPSHMSIALGNATLRSFGRIMGGMDNDPTELYPFFETALAGIDGGALWSGGTRCLRSDGTIQDSVAEVVAREGKIHLNLITMGSCPRVNRFIFEGESHLMLGNNTFINPSTQYVATIQNGAEDEDALGWDGDVRAYLEFMANVRAIMGFGLYGIVWNGGGVTVTETLMAYNEFDIPIFIVVGSGRQADDKLSAANFSGEHVHHISKHDPASLRQILIKYGLSR